MDKKIKNYSKEQKSKKKLLIIAGFLLCSLLIATTAVAAFYSDIVGSNGDVTTGTLKLNGTYTFYLNNTQTELSNIKNLNPGDVITVKCSVKNEGNKSAWIREVFSFQDSELLPYLSVYQGQFSQEDFFENTDLSQYAMQIVGGKAVSANKVIDGSGSYAETESGGSFNYVLNSQYDTYFTIYFSTQAGNSTQGKTFTLSVASQALQFRNNNFGEPTTDAWQSVVAL